MKLEAILNSEGKNKWESKMFVNGKEVTIYYQMYKVVGRYIDGKQLFLNYKIPNQRIER